MKVKFTGVTIVFLIVVHFFVPCGTFMGLWPDGQSHNTMTYASMKYVLVQYCNENPQANSKPVSTDMSIHDILLNYYGYPANLLNFMTALLTIISHNVYTDFSSATGSNANFHFDAERFDDTNQRLIEARENLVTLVQKQQFDLARQNLGQILHTIQDFYSHSNWVEMGKSGPNTAVGMAGKYIGTTASPNFQTCTNCSGFFPFFTCKNNVLTEYLTSGYFQAIYSSKPETDNANDQLYKPKGIGKCSHGGFLDKTSMQFPTGGINKDTPSSFDSPHYYLHDAAANLAIKASIYYLTELQDSVGSENFAKLLNLQSTALSIVIDTTGSMQPYIEAVKLRCEEIILTAAGSAFQPSEYILVPFNDPKYGPVYQTTDPQQMIAWINGLTAEGGGDIPEMCFHGLQLAEEASPSGTPIFVFTDAPPKDGDLFLNVLSLAENNYLTINFCGANLGAEPALITNNNYRNQNVGITNNFTRKDSINYQVGTFQMYSQLAAATGGYILTTTSTTANIFNSTAFIDSMLLSTTVNIIQYKEKSGSLLVNIPIDQTIASFTIMLSSSYNLNAVYSLRSPNGSMNTFQLLTDTPTTQYLQINYSNPGIWFFNISTRNSDYSVAVSGESAWNALLTFTQFDFSSPHPTYQVLNGNPIAGTNVTVFLTPLSNQVNITGMQMLNATSGSIMATLEIDSNSSGPSYSSTFEVPSTPINFVILGEDTRGNFVQRTNSKIVTPTTIHLSAEWNENSSASILPGQYLTLSFNITNLGGENTFFITVTDSLNFVVNYTPASVKLGSDMSAMGIVTLFAPKSAVPGSVSIMQLIAQIGFTELNNFLSMSVYVAPPEYDTFPPVCNILSSTLNETCMLTDNVQCSEYNWTAYMVFSDHGSGLYSVSTKSYGSNTTWYIQPFTQYLQDTNVTANATGDCCVQNATLLVVDGVGLIGKCFLARSQAPTTVMFPTSSTMARMTTTVSKFSSTTSPSSAKILQPFHSMIFTIVISGFRIMH